MASIATASQTIGPFFREALERPAWSDLTGAGAFGAPIRIEGLVLDGDRVPVADAMLELWQADPAGRFASHDDERSAAPADRFRGFGRACTDADGRYGFRTVMPGAFTADGGTPQAPHANLSIFARGLLKRLVTRIYFSAFVEENARDPLLASIADDAIRRTLVAQRAADGEVTTYRFDIVLQGEGETAFLAL